MSDEGTRSEESRAATGPLSGTKVIEITKYIQGPIAGLLLASLGADVIKIELVGDQDSMRSVRQLHGVVLDDRGRDWLYAAVNRNKRAMTLDVKSDSGKEIFHRLVASAEVFVTNLRDRGLRAIGADLDTLLGVNPTLVYAQGGGFGPRGPMAQDPCQDTVGMAFGGFMDLSSPTGDPNYPPGSLSDVLTGTNLAAAVMAGLLQARATGRGGLVRTSQVQSLLWLQMFPVGMLASLGERMPRFVRDQATPLYSAYPTGDGWMAIAAIHPQQWPPLARALGLEHLLDDERFEFARLEENKAALVPYLEDAFSRRSTADWHELLRAAGVWCAPVNRLEDLPGHEQVLANEYLVEFPDGFVATPVPFEVDGWPGVRGAAAAYSAQTDEILAELGVDDDQRADLRARSVVW